MSDGKLEFCKEIEKQTAEDTLLWRKADNGCYRTHLENRLLTVSTTVGFGRYVEINDYYIRVGDVGWRIDSLIDAVEANVDRQKQRSRNAGKAYVKSFAK